MRQKLTTIIFAMLLALSAGGATGFAQSPTPTPGGIEVNPRKINETFTQMSKSAVKFLRVMREEVEAPLNEYFYLLALALFSLISCAAFLRLKDANDGQITVLMVLRFIMRFATCAMVLTVILLMCDKMLMAGNFIAYGRATTSGNVEFRESWLGQLAREQQETFEASYERYLNCLFVVTVKGSPTDVTDPGDGTITMLGVTKDQGLSLATSTAQALTDGKWDPNAAFERLSWGRFAIGGADLFNVYLPNLLLILMRLFSLFAVSVAIDKGLAARITWQWLWGMVALTIILPILSQILRIGAYMAGNLALQVGDPAPIWNWDYASMTILKTGPGDPAMLVNAGFITMLIMAGMLLFSIVIAYQITMGKVYETGSQIASGLIFGGAATGIGVVSSAAAANLGRQAENAQISGQARAEAQTLKGSQESANMRDAGGAVAARAGSKASAFQGEKIAESSSIAAIERARSTDARSVREAGASHERTLTESAGRTEASDVEAQNATNQQRSGMSGSIVDAGKGGIGWLMGWGSGESGGTGENNRGGYHSNNLYGAESMGQAHKAFEKKPEQGVGGAIGPVPSGGNYGASRDYDRDGVRDEHHTGIDFGRAQGYHEGARVGAAAKGTVIYAGRDGGYGNRVVVDHGNGVATAYSHLQNGSINHLRPGQQIQRGTIIGNVGTTGKGDRDYPPHLHFEAGTLTGSTDKYGAPQMAKVDPASTSYRPFNHGKGVDPYAAMPTQTGQAMREVNRLREQGTVNASGDYTAALVTSSGIARDDEIGISQAQTQRDVATNWQAHDMRVSGINTQEKMNLNANGIMYSHGMKAMEERRDSMLDAAGIREKAALMSSAGSIAAQQVGRLSESFRF
jgi:murein DD-endopeptidase MepM/ murein hydrolase activator NlpD